MDGGTITCPGCKQWRDPQGFWDGRINLGVCGWCRGENNASYWPVPFSVLDKMPCLPDWDEDPESTRYSETVMVYFGSTRTDETVVDFSWGMGRLRQYRHSMKLDWSIDQHPYYDDGAEVWEVSHWMPLPTPPKGSENYEVPEFLKPAMREHLDALKR